MKIRDRVKPKTPPVAPGVYMAVCVGVVDLGEQYSEMYKKYSNRVKFVWALPTELMEVDGKQEERQISREFAVATKVTSKLRAFISSWNSKAYTDDEFLDLDIMGQVGKPCMLNIVLNDSGEYANVDSIMPIPNGMPVPVSKTAMFTWDMDAWDDATLEKLPAWVQEQIKKSTQYQKEHAPVATVAVEAPVVQAAPVQQQATVPVMAGGVPF